MLWTVHAVFCVSLCVGAVGVSLLLARYNLYDVCAPAAQAAPAQSDARGVNQRTLRVLNSGQVSLVASYAACSILRVLTQCGATLGIIETKTGER